MYFGMFYDPTFLLLIPAFIFAMIAQRKVNSAYERFSVVKSRNSITGAQAARKILDAHGLGNVDIEISEGKLSDHYDPRKKKMRLSPGVYESDSISAVSIAAHESGHAIQHAEGYKPLSIRNAIAVPVNIISVASWPLLIIGIIIIRVGYFTQGNLVFNIGIFAFLFVVLFHSITLPVELDASRRAKKELLSEGIIAPEEITGTKKVLNAAALTYVAALAVAVANLVRLILIRGRN